MPSPSTKADFDTKAMTLSSIPDSGDMYVYVCVFWFKTPLFLPHPFLLHLAVSIAMPYLAVNKGQQDQI